LLPVSSIITDNKLPLIILIDPIFVEHQFLTDLLLQSKVLRFFSALWLLLKLLFGIIRIIFSPAAVVLLREHFASIYD